MLPVNMVLQCALIMDILVTRIIRNIRLQNLSWKYYDKLSLYLLQQLSLTTVVEGITPFSSGWCVCYEMKIHPT